MSSFECFKYFGSLIMKFVSFIYSPGWTWIVWTRQSTIELYPVCKCAHISCIHYTLPIKALYIVHNSACFYFISFNWNCKKYTAIELIRFTARLNKMGQTKYYWEISHYFSTGSQSRHI